MEGELFYKTAFCSNYERLLCVCVQSLNAWRNLREEIANSDLRSKEAGDDLMRLQADYARAYSRLEKHKTTANSATSSRKSAGAMMRASRSLSWKRNIPSEWSPSL